jgi:hypothetical protein
VIGRQSIIFSIAIKTDKIRLQRSILIGLFCLSVYLSVSLSVCLSVCLSVFLSVLLAIEKMIHPWLFDWFMPDLFLGVRLHIP